MAASGEQIGVLFVCLGNICRSPLAEGLFLHFAQARGVAHRFDVDSAGTGGWHAGERADPRSLHVAHKHGIALPSRARKIDPASDWLRFRHIIAMDRQNRDDLLAAGAPHAHVSLLRSFDPGLASARGAALDVPDPYGGDAEGFENVFTMAHRACNGLLEHLLALSGNG